MTKKKKTNKPWFLFMSFLLSVLIFIFSCFLFLLAFSFPAYCHISKNMACLDFNISSEKRLVTQAMERRYAEKQSSKKKAIQVPVKPKLCFWLLSASVEDFYSRYFVVSFYIVISFLLDF